MAKSTPPELYEKIARKNLVRKAFEIIICFLLLSLLIYRVLTLKDHGFAWLLAFLCESWFTFMWFLTVNIKWNPVEYRTYPQRLLKWVQDLPPVDMFVTTADAVLEPSIITVNTVLSLLAVDYPANKLACYVSDDGCSPLTFYSLVEASKFAELWVPFCKKYNVQVRAPFRYFAGDATSSDDMLGFPEEWKTMKDAYGQLSRKIEEAAKGSFPGGLAGELAVFSNIDRRNHPTVIKVILENKESNPDGLPHLVYISREKRPNHAHHYKAGAMNVLTRVSGVMTNAPFTLNVDCDMFANNPHVILQAMCLLLGLKNERESAFVQLPQCFYDGLKDDPLGNQFVAIFEVIVNGMGGIQGPNYNGTGCFHRRKVIYGLWADDVEPNGGLLISANGKLADEEFLKRFGNSEDFVKSASRTLGGKIDSAANLSKLLEAAHQVAGCRYEYGTSWGSEVGWMYGSTVEDILTGLLIHRRGWKSVYYLPDPPAFLGCAPTNVPASMIQQKRWATGFLETLLSKDNPIFGTLTAKLQFRQCLAYLWLLLFVVTSIPEMCYAALPAYCIIANSNFLPTVQDPAIYIPVSLLLIYNIYTLLEYLQIGQSILAWWNNQKMRRIYSMSAWFFGVVSMILKLLGISETVFEVTQKDQSTSTDGNGGDVGAERFTFNDSMIFVPVTTLVLLQLTAFAVALFGLQPPAPGGHGSGLGEHITSVLVVIYFWPFFKGLFGKGKYGIPLSIISKSAALALLFVYLSKGA